ncbi:MAG: T9SS type A sorting domain-containing protein [Chitinivibrionales bacterium]|nr:T9SS type A sorting domain-containing protein [Chitinivibrionales bacterium]
MIVPTQGGRDGDDYYLEESVLWVCFAQYYKDTPLYFCIDARPGSTALNEMPVIGSDAVNPFTIIQNSENVSFELPDNSRSRISISSIDGKTLLQTQVNQPSISVPTHSLPSGMYLLNVSNGRANVSQSLLIP